MHRDIKPENCMVQRSNHQLKLVDFGKEPIVMLLKLVDFGKEPTVMLLKLVDFGKVPTVMLCWLNYSVTYKHIHCTRATYFQLKS